MSYIALYRKWRPVTFDDVVEQSSVVSILKNAVKQDRIGHAYLFCGTRGTGKTTIAKIFSRAINCINPQDGNPCNECEVCKGIINQSLLDVIEIDAASNNGVDNVRDIIEEIAYVPTRARFKVYIIDEVHMLSTGAFNALLKTLEEPPEYAIFLLATTDPQKLPATILSRCQRYEFKRIGLDSIVERLKTICKDVGVEAEEEALCFIAQAADGALRDAISIFDQCISTGNKELTINDVLNILGIASEKLIFQTAEAIISRKVEKLLLSIEEMIKEGKEIPEFIGSLIVFFRNLLVIKAAGDTKMINMSRDALEQMQGLAKTVDQMYLIRCVKELSLLERDIKWASQKKIILEVGLIKLTMDEEVKEVQVKNIATKTEEIKPEPVKSEPIKKDPIKPVVKAEPVQNKDISSTDRSLAKFRPVEEVYLKEVFLSLKDGKHMMVMSYLRNVRALYYSDTVVYLVFCGAGKEIKKDSMGKPENMEIISKAFQHVMEKDCAIRLFTEDEVGDKEEEKENDLMSRLGRLAEDGVNIQID